MRVARRFVVSGRVQGVGFRYFALEVARHEGLAGYVRNLDDGTVEAVAEGEVDAVDRFERAIRRGPALADVDEVRVENVTPGATGRTFRIA